MATKTLLLTLDYELYGDGSGDVFKHIVEPTNKILEIVHRYNAKLTFFFEVVEYWKLKEEWERGNRMGYQDNPVVAMEEQIKEAYRQGHDVQLHIHPQWVDAEYRDGMWHLNLGEWGLGGYVREGEYSLVNLLQKGKQTLEDLITPIDPEYRCIAIRAGGYNIQPSEEIVTSMMSVGLKIDTSIYPGGKETGRLSNYDYSAISPDLGMWHVGKRLEENGDLEIQELPIVAFPMVRFYKYFTKERLSGFLRNRKSAKNSLDAKTASAGKRSNMLDKIRYFFQTEWQTWDYCLFSSSQHRRFLKQIGKQSRKLFVLVGHPKSFSNGRGLETLMSLTKGKYEYKTFKTIISINE